VGETKMPEPIMVPTMSDMPLKRPTFRFRLTAIYHRWVTHSQMGERSNF
jgi:hypothetical protein